ncbi:hypothetical protein ACOSP7_012936 [Xanthoceras sorbifolium]
MVKNIPLVMLFLIPLITIPTLTNANPIDELCPGASTYIPNSTFGNNLKLLLQSLSSNTSLNAGFYNSFVGEDPDKVYGQALCRGDVNRTVCRNCIENASQKMLQNCTSSEATIWYELCQIQYSYQIHFLTVGYRGRYPEMNYERKSIPHPAQNKEALSHLMPRLITEASNDPSKMFAVGEIKSPESKTIYGLVQCTREISTNDCSSCLDKASQELSWCCAAKEGGIVVSPNCNVRFDLQRLFNYSGISLTYPKSADEERSELALLHNLARPTAVTLTQEGDLVSSQELPFMDLAIIRAATEDFSDSNKLGRGGFGTVYKGVLPDGKEIAVKRLSRKSWQGLDELENEIILIAKLQHRNLVRLLGCGIEGEEKLLIYEFMPNKSLDILIFDIEKRAQLNWKTFNDIINQYCYIYIYILFIMILIIYIDILLYIYIIYNDIVISGFRNIFGNEFVICLYIGTTPCGLGNLIWDTQRVLRWCPTLICIWDTQRVLRWYPTLFCIARNPVQKVCLVYQEPEMELKILCSEICVALPDSVRTDSGRGVLQTA